MAPIESHFAGASGRLERYKGNIETEFVSSESIARDLLLAVAWARLPGCRGDLGDKVSGCA